MKRILIQFPGHGGGRLFDADARDSVLEPFIHLRERFRQCGYELQTADDLPVSDCEWILFWDFYEDSGTPNPLRRLARWLRRRARGGDSGAPERSLYADCVRAGVEDRAVLFTGEPAVVWPGNWCSEVHERFRIVFTWNDRYVDQHKYHKFHWPVTSRFAQVQPRPFHDKKLLVNVSANKHSSHPQELYSARRDTIRHFENRHPDQFDLYGVGWESPGPGVTGFSSYRGTVRHKWNLFPRYRFGLCYENMRDEPGWITEKIFDCMRADCVPVYWGASNVEDYVDSGTFIDRRRFASDRELAEHLISMTAGEYEERRNAIRAYLDSERFAAFLSPAFADGILRVLEPGALSGLPREAGSGDGIAATRHSEA